MRLPGFQVIRIADFALCGSVHFWASWVTETAVLQVRFGSISATWQVRLRSCADKSVLIDRSSPKARSFHPAQGFSGSSVLLGRDLLGVERPIACRLPRAELLQQHSTFLQALCLPSVTLGFQCLRAFSVLLRYADQ